jgi:hypothetical protein
MILFLSAQDISCLEVGLLDGEGRLLSFQEFIARPEDYLAAIANFLLGHSVNIIDLKKVVVVSGPGSFTSTRIIVTIANTLSFANNLPVIGIVNTSRKNSKELLGELNSVWLKEKGRGFVSPVYDRTPLITLKTNSKI